LGNQHQLNSSQEHQRQQLQGVGVSLIPQKNIFENKQQDWLWHQQEE